MRRLQGCCTLDVVVVCLVLVVVVVLVLVLVAVVVTVVDVVAGGGVIVEGLCMSLLSPSGLVALASCPCW